MPKITDVFLRQTKCPDDKKHVDYFDDGLMVRISKTGKKTFRYTYRIHGKTRNMTLGRYPDISLKQARLAVLSAKSDLINGIDPQQARDESKKEKEIIQGVTVEEGLSIFINQHAKISLRTWDRYEKCFNALPDKIKKMLVVDVPRTTIRDYLLDIGDNKGKQTALQKYGYLKSAFAWLCEMEYVDSDPIVSLKKPFVNSPPRQRVLSDDELKKIIKESQDLGYPFGDWIILLTYTGQRRNEVANMQWSELDLEEAIWTIPGERTKNKKEHKVPLSNKIVDILKAIPEIKGAKYVFSHTYGEKPIQGLSKVKRRLDEAVGVQDWTYHDLRRTCATNLAKKSIPDVVISKILNHSVQRLQGVTSIYNQHDYLEERAHALNNYSDWLDWLVSDNGDNVVPLIR